VKCNNCGLDYITDNTTNCPRCSAPLLQQYQQQEPEPQYQQPQYQQGPEPQYQQPPQQQYAPPQGGYYQQQPPMPPKQRTPTVRKVDLTDSLIAMSSLLLIVAGLNNLSALSYNDPPAVCIILGFLSVALGLIGMAMLVMPALMKDVKQFLDMFLLLFGAVFALWGLAATFGNDLGWSGSMLVASGLGMLSAAMLRMGLLK
jgi:hypothetical protein